MKIHYLLCIVFLALWSCDSSEETNEEQKQEVTETDKIKLYPSELIDGPANIRQNRKGKVELSLHNNVAVETGVAVKGWYPIGVDFDLSDQQVKDWKINQGEKLFINGKEVGEAKTTFSLTMVNRRAKTGYYMGYTFKDNIQSPTILENQVAALIDIGENTKNSLLSKLSTLKFEELDVYNFEGIKGYCVYDPLVVDPSPMDRITVFFKGDQLVGVKHSRPLHFKHSKDLSLKRDFILSISKSIKDIDVNAFQKHINDVLGVID